MNIEQQIMAAIRPQLDRADELLDHYLADAPREVWEPIAAQFRPKSATDLLRDGFKNVGAVFDALEKTVIAAFDAITGFDKKYTRDDFTTAK